MTNDEWPKGPAVLLFRGTGFFATIIRWLTRSCWNHAALLTREGTVVESRPRTGVRETAEPQDWSRIDVFDVAGATGEQWDRAIAAARADVGKIRYDWIGDLKFLLGMDDNSKKLFCSEGVVSWLAEGGVLVVARTQAWKVSPAMLGMSPLLVQRNLKTES